MNTKIFVAITMLMLLMPSVTAGTASIVLELVDNNNDGTKELIATSVFDDDSSIEQVDVFVAGTNSTLRYPFSSVTQGQVFNVPFTSGSTISYNFNDTDGSSIGLGTLIIVQIGESNPPSCGAGCERNPVPTIIYWQRFFPRMAEGNSAYYVDYRVSLNPKYTYTNLAMTYNLNDGTTKNDKTLVFDGTYWTTTFGPFNQEVKIKVTTNLFDSEGRVHEKYKGGIFQLLLPSEGQTCNIGQVVTVSENETQYDATLVNNELIFAPLNGFSYLSIFKSANGSLKATQVIDDDSSIERVDVFYRIGENITQTTFSNVAQDQALGSIPTSADFSWFNYFDSDGTISNISVLNQFSDASVPVILPPVEESKKPNYVNCIKLIPVVASNEKSFEVFVELCKGKDTPQTIKYNYTVDNGAWKAIANLADLGDKWRGSLGVYDGQVILSGYYDATGPLGTRASGSGYDNWYSLIPKEQLECKELCFDATDNDLDGLTDEGCVLLSELFFQKKNIPFFSLSEQPIKGDITIKNSGVVNATAFDVDFYINQTQVFSQQIPILASGASEKVSFSVPYKPAYDGENTVRVEIDADNSVVELLESNNFYEQELSIGKNFFDVILNYNEAYFPGDYKEIKIRDAYERIIENATIKILFPSGKEINLASDSQGIVKFQLTETGTYSITVSKEDFVSFEGTFTVSEIELVGLSDTISIGSSQSFIVQNEEQRQLTDGTVQISSPTGTILEFELNSESRVSFAASQQGRYGLRIVRNEIVIYESNFLATGLIESLLVGSDGLLDLVFGSIIRTPVLFVLLLVLSLGAAYSSYNKASIFFRKGAKGTTEKRIESAMRIGIAIVFFVAPFQFDRFFGFNAGIAAVFLEVAILLLYDYYLQNMKGTRKAIKV